MTTLKDNFIKKTIMFIAIVLLAGINSQAQRQINFTELYKQALMAIAEGDTAAAENLFLSSISEFDDHPSYYQLSLIYQVKNTISSLNIAREHIKKAIERNETNILYHLTFASILERLFLMSEFEFDARSRAVNEFEKILEIDSNFSFAWYKLGKFKRDDYLEFSNSFLRMESSRNFNTQYDETEEFAAIDQVVSGTTNLLVSDGRGRLSETESRNLQSLNQFIESSAPLISYEGEAEEDFLDAEFYLKKAIDTNPNNFKARNELGFLYEDANRPEEAIPLFEELVEENPLDKDAHLFLGLLYYEIGEMENASESFQNALSLMTNEEFKNYTFYSVLLLLEPILGERASKFSIAEFKIFIDAYWKVRDPFNLTEYNERILEHYARVTYSNFRFSIAHKNIKGWQTDMGEMMIRYGEPPARKKFRQGVNFNDFAFYDLNNVNYDYLLGDNVKTEVWYYDNVAIAFTDQYSTGDYKYHDPYANTRRSFSQFNSGVPRNNLVKNQPEMYTPRLHGEVLNLPYNAIQFRGKDNKTDVFINYGLNFREGLSSNGKFIEEHDAGLFFFDRFFNPVVEQRERITFLDLNNKIWLTDTSSLVVNTFPMTLKAQTGNCAFEIQKTRDKSVASYHGRYNVRDFSADTLMMSDILIAADAGYYDDKKYTINRKDITILPNPAHTFSENNDLFLYFEVYNLQKNENDLTNFTQTIEVEFFEDQEIESLFSVIGSLFELIGIGGGDKIELTSDYQTQEIDPQIYLQLDLSDYDEGKYLINVTIQDNIAQREVAAQSLIIWK